MLNMELNKEEVANKDPKQTSSSVQICAFSNLALALVAGLSIHATYLPFYTK